jgi:hypothetical protein
MAAAPLGSSAAATSAAAAWRAAPAAPAAAPAAAAPAGAGARAARAAVCGARIAAGAVPRAATAAVGVGVVWRPRRGGIAGSALVLAIRSTVCFGLLTNQHTPRPSGALIQQQYLATDQMYNDRIELRRHTSNARRTCQNNTRELALAEGARRRPGCACKAQRGRAALRTALPPQVWHAGAMALRPG